MNIPKDPVILLSFLNTQLRDHFSSLEELLSAYMLSEEDILSKMNSIQYTYDKDSNRFI